MLRTVLLHICTHGHGHESDTCRIWWSSSGGNDDFDFFLTTLTIRTVSHEGTFILSFLGDGVNDVTTIGIVGHR